MEPSELTEAEVERLIQEQSVDAGLDPPAVRWHNGATENSAETGGREIRLNRRILRRDDEARYVALHELGHIALGHTSLRQQHKGAALYLVILLGTLAVAFVLLALALGFRLAGVGVWIFVFLALPLAGGLAVRPREVAADHWAVVRGGPLTADLAAHFASRTTWSRRFVRAFINSHPSDFRRAQLVLRSAAS